MTLSVRRPRALEARIAELEEREDHDLAEQASARIRAGEERTWTHEELVHDLQLID